MHVFHIDPPDRLQDLHRNLRDLLGDRDVEEDHHHHNQQLNQHRVHRRVQDPVLVGFYRVVVVVKQVLVKVANIRKILKKLVSLLVIRRISQEQN